MFAFWKAKVETYRNQKKKDKKPKIRLKKQIQNS